MLAPVHPKQQERLAAIASYDLGDGTHAGRFDGIVELAFQICNCPIALVSIVHADGQRFEAACGLSAPGTGLDAAICSHAILQDDILEIPDCRLDMRTRDNPLVKDPDDPLLFYAGAPITTEGGLKLGTLCVLDRRPRRLGDAERRALTILAEQVMKRLELHEALARQDALRREVDHRVKNSLANVSVLTRMAARSAPTPEARTALMAVESRIRVMVELHGELYRSDAPDTPLELSDYLSRITGHLDAIAPGQVVLSARFAQARLEPRRASALGVVVNELVSNACKHAFGEGAPGRIEVEGVRLGPTTYRVTCADDGMGLADSSSGNGGLGQRIIEASVSQLQGEMIVETGDRGHSVRVDFPVSPD